jgi:hypothetical protein
VVIFALLAPVVNSLVDAKAKPPDDARAALYKICLFNP